MYIYNFKINEEGKILYAQDTFKGVYPNSINFKNKEVNMKQLAKEHKNSILHLNIEEIPEGKITPTGEYPKFKNDEDCAFPERGDCNYGTGYERCKYMEYGGRPGCWFCRFKKGD